MNREDFNSIAESVFAEVQSAEKKHPEFPDDLVYKAALLSEEAGEAVREANFVCMEKKKSVEDFKEEVTQAACVCFRILATMED